MRKDLCPIDLLALDNQMEEFIAHEWPYEQARKRAEQERKERLIHLKERLIDLAGFVALLVLVVLVSLLIAGGER